MAELERVERLLTMLLLEQLGSASQARKIDVLLKAGFKNVDVAALLGTTSAVVAQTAYAAKKGSTRQGARPKAKPKR